MIPRCALLASLGVVCALVVLSGLEASNRRLAARIRGVESAVLAVELSVTVSAPHRVEAGA